MLMATCSGALYTRTACRLAWERKKSTMLTSDVIDTLDQADAYFAQMTAEDRIVAI